MRTETFENQLDEVTGYDLELTAEETRTWANTKPYWPCSRVSGHDLEVEVGEKGLLNMKIDDRIDCELQIPGNELDAIVAEHQPEEAKHLWPAWEEE